MSTGRITISRVNGRARIDRADRHVLISTQMVQLMRQSPSEWARADDDTMTISDGEKTYTYRIVPHSPEVYAGERIDGADS